MLSLLTILNKKRNIFDDKGNDKDVEVTERPRKGEVGEGGFKGWEKKWEGRKGTITSTYTANITPKTI